MLVCAALASLTAVSASTIATNRAPGNWAVLIAGSSSYFNYRHQADVSHAFQLLVTLGGFPKENVIVMMFNDVVTDTFNPFPGRLYNEPNGVDVYPGDVNVSYSGDQVSAETFLNVLQGIKKGDTLHGPVIQSSANDMIFVYYSDHGATGMVGMPNGSDPLFADDLNKALHAMHADSRYAQLVFYLESCESGSMFADILPSKINVFAVTAATPAQPSYAYYYNSTLATYLADEFSVRWMQDSTKNWNSSESLLKQFENVAEKVKQSQPQKYGDTDFDAEPIQDFQGAGYEQSSNQTELQVWMKKILHQAAGATIQTVDASTEAVNSRDVKLAVLQNWYLGANDINSKMHWASAVTREIGERSRTDLLFYRLVTLVVNSIRPPVNLRNLIKAIRVGHVKPSNFQCLKLAYKLYPSVCQQWTDYSLKYVNLLNNLCDVFVKEAPALIQHGFAQLC